MSPLAQLDFDTRDGAVIARLAGEIDVSNAAALGERLGESPPSDSLGLVVDLSGTGFLDSSGISMLFTLARKLSGRRLQLRVAVPPSSPVRRVFELVDFQKAAPLDDSLEESLRAFADGAPPE